MAQLSNVQCTLLIGMYAQLYYAKSPHRTLTDRVKHWRDYAPESFLLPHPSLRNQLWLRRNPLFESELVPALQAEVRTILDAP